MLNPSIIKECKFKSVRSSGKGGQHVNKVSTKVEIYFNIETSQILSDEQKILLREKLRNQLNYEGELRIVSDEERSQLRNKKRAVEKLNDLFIKALLPVKKRIKTKTPKVMKETRIRNKKFQSDIKLLRKKPDIN